VDQGLKEDSKAWGAYMRMEFSGHNRTGILGKVKDEAWGASSGRPGASLPIPHSCPPRLMYIHRAYVNDMNDEESRVFYAQFVPKGSPKQKAAALGMSVPTMYRRLDAAMNKIPRGAE